MLVAGLATVACAALARLGEVIGMVGTKPFSELLTALILFRLFPEERLRWSVRQVLTLFGIAAILALVWIIFFAWGRTKFPDTSGFDQLAIIVGAASSVVTAPLFEEKVVRHLLLQGVSELTNRWIATIFVSLLFSLAHQGSVAWTFIVSSVLCWLALWKGVGSLQRAVVHGALNAMVFLWYFTSGYGFFA